MCAIEDVIEICVYSGRDAPRKCRREKSDMRVAAERPASLRRFHRAKQKCWMSEFACPRSTMHHAHMTVGTM